MQYEQECFNVDRVIVAGVSVCIKSVDLKLSGSVKMFIVYHDIASKILTYW